MNIFVLDPNPIAAARMHCDKHMHKMILESAQMLSVWCAREYPESRPHIYVPAYANHPATKWVCRDIRNVIWLIQMATELNVMREECGSMEHSSMRVILAIADYIPVDSLYLGAPRDFEFCGPNNIRYRTDLNVHEKYQELYRTKAIKWAGVDMRRPMTYTNRPVPEFLRGLKESNIVWSA